MKEITPTIKPTTKQYSAWKLLQDDITKYIVFGGAAGGGKSWLGCEWLLTNCYFYPGSKWFIGREELKRLMASSYVTWNKVCAYHEIPRDDWKLNGQYNYIEFKNGSRIDLLDVAFQPKDPLYERFGSTEYTGGWLEEAGEIHFGAFDVLKSRIGRHMNKEQGVRSKLLITCNPKKNWLYRDVYKPWKEKTLPKEYAFIQSLYGDNPHTAEEYGDNLKQIKNESMKQRLMYGNWEYDDDPSVLIEYDAIIDLWTNTVGIEHKYLSADIARFGDDKTVLFCWRGMEIYKVFVYTKQATNVTTQKIDDLLRSEQIPRSHVVIDQDGVGGGVVDALYGCKPFTNNARAKEYRGTLKVEQLHNGSTQFKTPKQNYKNLKAQCHFVLAEMVNERKIAFAKDVKFEADNDITFEQFKLELIEELEQIKADDTDDDTKPLNVVAKDDIKEAIGRSPDYSDAMMMKMYFELNETLNDQVMEVLLPIKD